MEYYESTRPTTDDSGLSGGVSFQFGGKIATQSIKASTISYNYQRRQGGGGDETVTIDLCVNGVPMKLDVRSAGQPYIPE